MRSNFSKLKNFQNVILKMLQPHLHTYFAESPALYVCCLFINVFLFCEK